MTAQPPADNSAGPVAKAPNAGVGNPGPRQPEIIAFCCNYCAYAAADLAGARRMQYPPNVRIIHVPCTGKVEMEHILEAFERGIDGVLVAGCLEGGCHFVEGNLRAKKRAAHVRQLLDTIGVGGGRLAMVNLSSAMAPTFVESVTQMLATVTALGPNPLKPAGENRGQTPISALRPPARAQEDAKLESVPESGTPNEAGSK